MTNRRKLLGSCSAIILIACASRQAGAADLDHVVVTPPVLAAPQQYNWTGLYAGGNLGNTWGSARWSGASTATPGVPFASGSHTLSQSINSYDDESGSWFAGVQAGYNYMLPNRIVVGAVADVNSSSFYNISKLNQLGGQISTGGASTMLGGSQTFIENIQDQGTFRAKLGYAPGNLLVYATGGFAWDYEFRQLSQPAIGGAYGSYRARPGYVVGAGLEAPLVPQWTAFMEATYNNYGSNSVTFPVAGQTFTSKDHTFQVKAGVNFHPYDSATASAANTLYPGLNPDEFNFHTDAVAVYQGYPSFNSPYSGAKSFRANGEAREVAAIDFWAGARLWQGAEFWINPELNQGFGVGGTVGIIGYPNNSSFKIGQAAPYARVEAYFVRQTFNFAGTTSDLAAGESNFAGTQSDHRLVITAGRIPFDIIGTSNYFDIRAGFSSWNYGFPVSVDYGSDAWGSTYGALAEYYFGRFAFRVCLEDLTEQPADTLDGEGLPLARGFANFHASFEAEENHTIFGQPGKIKALGFFDHGSMANINSAITFYNTYGPTAEAAALGVGPSFEPVRRTATKPGFLLELEQHITTDIGFFAMYGQEDGRYEVQDDTDSDQYAIAGIAVAGTKWGRPDDTLGIAGGLNNISGEYKRFLSEGGLGLFIGDGALYHSGPELNFDTYYKYQLTSRTSLTLDYQHITNPATNEDRGPINLFLGRVRYYY